MGGAAAAAGGTLLGPLAGSASADDVDLGPSINGTLKQVRAPDTLVLEDVHLSRNWAAHGLSEPEGAEVSVTVNDETSMYRDRDVEITAFRPGDTLIAEVRAEGDELVASSVGHVYVAVEGVVESQAGDRLQTSAGTIVVTDNTIVHPSALDNRPARLREISAKDRASTLQGFKRIAATCRVDPAAGQYVAQNIADLGAR